MSEPLMVSVRGKDYTIQIPDGYKLASGLVRPGDRCLDVAELEDSGEFRFTDARGVCGSWSVSDFWLVIRPIDIPAAQAEGGEEP